MRMLDLFCGRCGLSRIFAERGWDCVVVDLVEPPNMRQLPRNIEFYQADVLGISHWWIQQRGFDFLWASSTCDGFASFGMKHFRPNPPHPEVEIRLFEHTRHIFQMTGLPHIMENVRPAQQFVGKAQGHCGPFYLWGNAVPPILPQGISKAKWTANSKIGRQAPGNFAPELNLPKTERKAKLAEIPSELANCVASYAERLLEQKAL